MNIKTRKKFFRPLSLMKAMIFAGVVFFAPQVGAHLGDAAHNADGHDRFGNRFVDAPGNLQILLANSATAGGALSFGWNAVVADGGRSVVGYAIHMRTKAATSYEMACPFSGQGGSANHVLAASVTINGVAANGGILGTATSTVLHGVPAGVQQICMRATEEDSDHGHWAELVEITVPDAPANITVDRSAGTTAVSWDAVTDATGYKIRWAETEQKWINTAVAAGEDAAGTSFDIPNLDVQTTYNLQVAAITAAGPSAWSATISTAGVTISSVATLNNLQVIDADGTVINATFGRGNQSAVTNPAGFAADNGTVLEYSVELPPVNTTVKIRATTTDAAAKWTVTASRNSGGFSLAETAALDSAADSPAFVLLPGRTQRFTNVTVTVTAEDGSTVLNYTLRINIPDTDAAVRYLGVCPRLCNQETLQGVPVNAKPFPNPLVPTFGPDTFSYTTTAPFSLDTDANNNIFVRAEPRDQENFQSITFTSPGMDNADPALSYPAYSFSARIRAAGASGDGFSPAGIPQAEGIDRAVTIVLFAEDAVTSLTYTLVVTPQTTGSGDAELGVFGVTDDAGNMLDLFKIGGGGSKGFDPSHANYRINDVGFVVAALNFNATPNEEKSRSLEVTKRGDTAVIASGFNTPLMVPLDTGANDFDFVVTAENGSKKVYGVSITRLQQSTDARLSALQTTRGSLTPPFMPDINDYTIRIPNSAADITITPTLSHPQASVTLNGNALNAGETSFTHTLAEGANTLTLVVTAEDGVATETYTIHAGKVAATPSSDSSLASVSLSNGGITFAAETLSYAVEIANDVAEVSVTAAAGHVGVATLTIDGDPIISGKVSDAIALEVDTPKTVEIIVTAADDSTRTYQITFTRALSGDNSLSMLALSPGTLTSALAANVFAYTAEVENTVTFTTITATATADGASIAIDGEVAQSGANVQSKDLIVGDNTIEIVVTAADGDAQTYTLTITRLRSADAALSDLTVSIGNLLPGFDAETTTYSVRVANSIATVTLTPTARQTDATVSVNNAAVNSGEASRDLALTAGIDNVIRIIVTAPDETAMREYVVTIARAAQGASAVATLDSLALVVPGAQADVDVDLEQTFDAATLTYTANPGNFANFIKVAPVATDSLATVTVNGVEVAGGESSEPIPLTAGITETILVEVEAQDAGRQTYTLLITREAGPPSIRNLQVQSAGLRFLATWEADDGGSPVTTYRLRYKKATESEFLPVIELSDDTLATTLVFPQAAPWLEAVEYDVQVSAVNATGASGFEPVTAAAAKVNLSEALNIDASESGAGAHDAIILARYLLGVRGPALGAGQTGNDETAITENIAAATAALDFDIDGDNEVDEDDGILIARYLSGLRGEPLVQGITGASAENMNAQLLRFSLP